MNAAKGAYDEYGFMFAADYFDENVGINPLAKLFISEFQAAYGEMPDFYAANFYENTLAMWDVIRRVIASGGDINSGADLDAAFQADLTAASVYGGDATTVGKYEIDPVSHTVIRRPMGIFERKGGSGHAVGVLRHQRRRLPRRLRHVRPLVLCPPVASRFFDAAPPAASCPSFIHQL
ncbi:MAG: hypothetical protein R2715_19080 [Ilumatobacteraceae bacterium]